MTHNNQADPLSWKNSLLSHVRKYASITDEEAADLFSFVHHIPVKKKTLLLKEGDLCKHHYFVHSGCLRLYFIDDKGAEHTVQFAIENWWITDYTSYHHGRPGQFYLQAIEDCSIVAIDKLEEAALFNRLPTLEHYFRQLLVIAAGAAQWRITYVFSRSKEEMYKQFNASFPGFVQRVPQYMLASYLGLTPEYLSEIRKKRQ